MNLKKLAHAKRDLKNKTATAARLSPNRDKSNSTRAV
jgi:hypothetical protein